MGTLLRGGVVLPMAPERRRRLLQPGSVLFDGVEIVAVGTVEELDADPRAAGPDVEVIDATGFAVLPGLHNCHLHSGLLRGTAEGLALFDWLQTYVDPAHRALTPEIAEAASWLCYAEALRSGTTSVMDMWRFLDGSARVAGELGIRATLVPYVADETGYDYFESIDSTRALLAKHRESYDGRVRSWVGLEHLFYCTERAFADASALAAEYDTGLHVHSSESRWEVEESLRRYGHRPLAEIARRGALDGGRAVVAHCVWLDDAEIDLLAATGTRVAHCPASNMKLASGPAPVPKLWAAGVTVGIGSDGEKENNNLDILEEAKIASLLQKLVGLDPTAGDPWDILAMATIEGARCLGLGELTGSLEPGKRADVIMVDLRKLHTTPLLSGADANVAAHLVFSSSGQDVDSVWADGRRLLAGGRLLTAAEAAIRSRAQAAAEELFARRAALT
ncbi:amidohydrolase [Frankia sp. AgW1.1]|uniref:amidohydrolase n=1 Tax=Frankia sp. AgW1.1 TaxID=1836971 RepID=UPI0019345A53|nr:amidohydrolase [Frankia sp. AgW1.1]MBL7493309.1 amidohydrolase [Frankia sp. AgW1.1]